MAEMAVPAVRVSKAGKEEAEVASAAAVAEVRTARRGLRVIQAKEETPVYQALNLCSRSRPGSIRPGRLALACTKLVRMAATFGRRVQLIRETRNQIFLTNERVNT